MNSKMLFATLALFLAFNASAALAAELLKAAPVALAQMASTRPTTASKLEAALRRMRESHQRLQHRHDRVIKPGLYRRSMAEFNNDPRFPRD